MLNLIRRFGKWIAYWPCDHSYHEWSLYRPGRSMWHRRCVHCDDTSWDCYPDRADCDVDYYNQVYLPRMKKERKRYPVRIGEKELA